MKILVINSGSSSLKFSLILLPSGKAMVSGSVEEIGKSNSQITYKTETKYESIESIKDHGEALEKISKLLFSEEYGVIKNANELHAIGHRVVHGGEVFNKTTLITKEVKEEIKKLSSLAPLHNPANLLGIEFAEKIFEGIKQYAVFDTSFHSSIPDFAFRYAVPNDWYSDYGVRVYGFHGTSHKYVFTKAKEFLNLKEQNKVITLHLGNGGSVSAIKNGKCIDTSMGLGPLSGLMMGTRSGDIDPSVIFHLVENGFSLDKVKTVLNKESGLKGISGDNDFRVLHKKISKGDENAKLALEMYVYRLKKYIGAYIAILGGIDAIVFTAGVGENDEVVRENVTEGLSFLGIEINKEENNIRKKETRNIGIGKVPVLIIPTNEELAIAQETKNI